MISSTNHPPLRAENGKEQLIGRRLTYIARAGPIQWARAASCLSGIMLTGGLGLLVGREGRLGSKGVGREGQLGEAGVYFHFSFLLQCRQHN